LLQKDPTSMFVAWGACANRA